MRLHRLGLASWESTKYIVRVMDDASRLHPTSLSSMIQAYSTVVRSKPEPPSKRRPKVVLNIADTKYPVVRHVAKKVLAWRLSLDPNSLDWDVLWTDTAVSAERLSSMKKHQKINHFPGMFGISRKDYLARNLKKMKGVYSDDYDFFPQTWLIPTELFDFKAHCATNKGRCYIAKPESSSQGKGIYLVRRPEDLVKGDRCVVQSYLERPYLIDDLKFDMRIYVLVTGCDPLRVYVHEEGLTRFATEEYEEPCYENLDTVCMHLTNYAVNKNNSKYQFNEDADEDEVGHKRSLASTFQYLEEQGHNIDLIWQEICDMAVKTLCSIQPNLAHVYKSCQPDDIYSGMCFELLGLDVILDSNLKPWLLEVNHSPSFTVDSPLDERVKVAVIGDTLKLLGITPERRQKLLKDQQVSIHRRNWLGKTTTERRMERRHMAQEAQTDKDAFERSHLGGFTMIYPMPGTDCYEGYMETAGRLWESWTCLKARVPHYEPRPSTHSGCKPGKGSNARKPRVESVTRGKIEVVDNSVFERLYGGYRPTARSESPTGMLLRSRPQTRPHSSYKDLHTREEYTKSDLRQLKDLTYEDLGESSSQIHAEDARPGRRPPLRPGTRPHPS